MALGKNNTSCLIQIALFNVDNLRFWIRMSEVHNTCKDDAGIYTGKEMFNGRMT